MRFFAYHLMGQGVFLSKDQLLQVHPGLKKPFDLKTYMPIITRCTSLDGIGAAVDLKIEASGPHKLRKATVRLETKREKKDQINKFAAEREAAAARRRTSKRCAHCERPFLWSFYKNTHERNCLERQKSTIKERKTTAIHRYVFDILQGHAQRTPSNSSTLVPLSELCNIRPAFAMPCLSLGCTSEHASSVPYSVACVVRGMIATLAYNSDRSSPGLPLRGWASREANVRPSSIQEGCCGAAEMML